MKRRRPNWRSIKLHRNYTVDEISRLTGYAKITVRRWIKSETLPAITDRKPILVLGADLRDFFGERTRTRHKLEIDECYCLKCRTARRPALGMADYVPLTEHTGNLTALCEVCSTVMHKAFSVTMFDRLSAILSLTIKHADKHIVDTTMPCSDDHFNQEAKADA